MVIAPVRIHHPNPTPPITTKTSRTRTQTFCLSLPTLSLRSTSTCFSTTVLVDKKRLDYCHVCRLPICFAHLASPCLSHGPLFAPGRRQAHLDFGSSRRVNLELGKQGAFFVRLYHRVCFGVRFEESTAILEPREELPHGRNGGSLRIVVGGWALFGHLHCDGLFSCKSYTIAQPFSFLL